jgi:exodeoxyribonuclease V alpha subunit
VSGPANPPSTLRGVLERIVFLNEENSYTIAELRPDSPESRSDARERIDSASSSRSETRQSFDSAASPSSRSDARERVDSTSAPASRGAARESSFRTAPAARSAQRAAKAADSALVTVVGVLPGVQCGETLSLDGEWVHHPQHGAQFKIVAWRSELPASVYGIRKYLGSGLVHGIGKTYANKIVDHFGADTLRVISDESARLREVAGIGPSRATAIKKSWEDQRALREILIFLQTYGVTPSQCVKLVGRYGPQAKQILLAEPYRVAREIDGIGFKTADKIAINLGFANDAAPRLDAGLLFALAELAEEGHTAYGENDLRAYTAELLQTDPNLLAARIAALVEQHALVRHGDAGQPATAVQLPLYHRAEEKIATAVVRVTRAGSCLPPIKVEAAIVWAQEQSKLQFADHQVAALRAALTSKVSILTGGPGTGKTATLRALVAILKAKKVRVHLAAPTGRAAKRIAETTGGFAQTIHRLLKYDPAKSGFLHDSASPLPTDFLVVDEASMLDTRLAASLLQAVPSTAHILLVGDVDQLPSVGAGNVLKDLIASGLAPVTRLAVIFRQQQQSQIVVTAHAVNHGDATLPPTITNLVTEQLHHDLLFVPVNSAEECIARVIELCTKVIPQKLRHFDPVAEVQVLAPMHKGVAGVGNLNRELQHALNPNGRALRSPAGELRAGDKLIQLRNNYDKGIFNGDIAVVTSVEPEDGTLEADFDGTKQTLDRGDLGDVALAYACSIHKSQGSEYPVVIVPLLKAHFMMLQRNLLYTAITRGKKRVFIVGEPAAWGMAIRNNESRDRRTHLREKLALLAS